MPLDRPTPGTLEQRAATDTTPTVEGRRLRGVIPFGVESRDLGGWREVMVPGGNSAADIPSACSMTTSHGRSENVTNARASTSPA